MEEKALSKAEINSMTKGISNQGIVEVRLVNPKRTGTIVVRDYRVEDENGSIVERKFVDANGNSRVEKINRRMKLNLSVLSQRLYYAHLKDHPIYVKGPNPVIQLVDTEIEAKQFLTQRGFKNKAETYITEATAEEVKNLLKVLAISIPPQSSETVMKQRLIEYIDSNTSVGGQSNAERLIMEINSEDYEIKVAVLNAKTKGTIEVKLNRWFFGEIVVGTDLGSTVKYFQDNQDLLESLLKM